MDCFHRGQLRGGRIQKPLHELVSGAFGASARELGLDAEEDDVGVHEFHVQGHVFRTELKQTCACERNISEK